MLTGALHTHTPPYTISATTGENFQQVQALKPRQVDPTKGKVSIKVSTQALAMWQDCGESLVMNIYKQVI